MDERRSLTVYQLRTITSVILNSIVVIVTRVPSTRLHDYYLHVGLYGGLGLVRHLSIAHTGVSSQNSVERTEKFLPCRKQIDRSAVSIEIRLVTDRQTDTDTGRQLVRRHRHHQHACPGLERGCLHELPLRTTVLGSSPASEQTTAVHCPQPRCPWSASWTRPVR